MSTLLADKRFLIVDDFAQMRNALRGMLSSLQIRSIDSATNGNEALNRLANGRYDVILCDYNLGDGKNGQQVLEEAQAAQLLGPKTIFVLLSGENASKIIVGALEHRPDDYLAKPFNKGLLRSRLENLVERKMELSAVLVTARRGDFNAAIKLCNHLIAKKTKNLSEVLRLKAEYSLEIGDIQTASEVYNQVLSLRSIPWALHGLGHIAYRSDNYEKARSIFTKLTREHPTYLEGYDALIATLEQLDAGPGEIQKVLSEAVMRSPTAVRRQQQLGRIASLNGDSETAEQAFRKAVEVGRFSIHKSANDYTGLAKALNQNGSAREALDVLGTVSKEFKGDKDARLRAALAESSVLHGLGLDQASGRAMDEASGLYEQLGQEVSTVAKLGMARVHLERGDTDKATELMQDVVRNNHEDKELLAEVQISFDEAGLTDEGSALIADTTNEVLQLNNRGVNLAKQGSLADAMQVFEDALEIMPSNPTVNLNAAQVTLIAIKRNGMDHRNLEKVYGYLQTAKRHAPEHPQLGKLQSLYDNLVQGDAQ